MTKTEPDDYFDVYRLSEDHTRWGQQWQAEWDDYVDVAWLWCPRACTRRGVLRKAKRWLRKGTDIIRHEAKYGPNLEARRIRAEYLSSFLRSATLEA